ncbi:MAG: ABC-2 type transport system permease protein [Parvicellaceae bacterium]|jgi:ABC-2 type transport system permease protein
MRKLFASIKKEFLVLVNDKVGLILMYLMPILLVFIITIVQDSTFKIVNENNIEVLIVNKDKGELGDSLISLLKQSGTLNIDQQNQLSVSEIQKTLLNGDQLLAIELPENFTESLKAKANNISTTMLLEFGVLEDSSGIKEVETKPLTLFYDPVLQESFRASIVNGIGSYMNALDNKLMIQSLYTAMGYDEIPAGIEDQFMKNKTGIEQISANTSAAELTPNSTQHNVPAWSIFAMFFMVISLGGNIVKERLSASFVRLQTIPASFSLVLIGKMFIYLVVALSQLAIIFLLGMYVFPLIGLPALIIPPNFLGLLTISVLSALTAISFAMLVGTYAKTQEQANGFGAITVVILASIGGIWVPTFVMPSYLQTIGNISPLHWCLEGFYTLFLKGGDWHLLTPALLFLIIFIIACQMLIFIKLKLQNYV